MLIPQIRDGPRVPGAVRTAMEPLPQHVCTSQVGAGATFHTCAITVEVRNVGWWWVPGSLWILQGFQVRAQFGFIRHFLLLAHFSVLNRFL